ncbi:hypothetical protein OKW21_000329 [Catalinimonas alkaloidigena]|uniref:hypothetical protein n=1 Tax=Catalinimonas alkaloidigena TaxID=1075417 RepID=UPI00240654B8|nr:hypothetical protein [Catalinimonas alkaloidigena]MDF9795066.1 hypothetical protein [Catalinimonas alkaloidigena]
MKLPIFIVSIVTLCCACSTSSDTQQEQENISSITPLVPQIEGDWWQIAANPDLGELTSEEQQPVDFGIWQAADGSWQVWSCIRKTNAPGKTRLFHRWEGKQLRDTLWQPMGIAMQADTNLGEEPGGMQAPYVLQHEGEYLMFYGDWNRICLAKSEDGKEFTRVLRDGSPALFGDTTETNTRDAMVKQINDLWYCYYTAHPGDEGAVYLRTSDNLYDWSDSQIVAYGGEAAGRGNGQFWLAECPHVVQPAEGGAYYLFRTQSYGRLVGGKLEKAQKTTVYASPDPTDFGIDDDRYFVDSLEVAAPEIFQHEGQWYIASLQADLQGIQLARLNWVAKED